MSKISLLIFIVSVTLLGFLFSAERLQLSNFHWETSPPLWPSSNLPYAQSGPTAPPPWPDLVVVKTADPDPATASSVLTYTVTITNQEVISAENVILVDALPAGVIVGPVTTSQGSCNAPMLNFLCSLGTIAGKSVVTITAVVTPTVAGEIVNQVIVVSTTPDLTPTNNRTELITQVGFSSAPGAQKIYLPVILNWRGPPIAAK